MNMSERERALAKRKLSGYLRSNPNVAAILVSHRQDDIPPLFNLGITLQESRSHLPVQESGI